MMKKRVVINQKEIIIMLENKEIRLIPYKNYEISGSPTELKIETYIPILVEGYEVLQYQSEPTTIEYLPHYTIDGEIFWASIDDDTEEIHFYIDRI